MRYDSICIERSLKNVENIVLKSVINLIRKGYNLTTIAHSLRQDYFSKNIDTVPHLYIDLADWSLGSQNLGASVQGVQYFRHSYLFIFTIYSI
jgi:hypothetical protein